MKCDELKYERLGDAFNDYPDSTLVIRKQYVDAAIAELKSENRRLKRALWLARAAMCRTYDICTYFIEHPESKRRFKDFLVLIQKAAATAAIKAEEYK